MSIFSTKRKLKSKEIRNFYLINHYFICTEKKKKRNEKSIQSNNTPIRKRQKLFKILENKKSLPIEFVL